MTDTDWRKEKLKSMLDAATHSINRARYVFLVSNIAGVVTLTGLMNSYFPWIRNIIARKLPADAEQITHYKKVLVEDLQVLNIPLLGVKIQIDDLSLFASCALLVIAIWQYYCILRENQIIYTVREEAVINSADKECVAYLYHGIAHYFVFTTAFMTDINQGNTKINGAKTIVQILFYMPGWIPLLLFVTDISSIFIYHKTQPGIDTLAANISPAEIFEIFAKDSLVAIMCAFSLYFCAKCTTLDNLTRYYIVEMKNLTIRERY